MKLKNIGKVEYYPMVNVWWFDYFFIMISHIVNFSQFLQCNKMKMKNKPFLSLHHFDEMKQTNVTNHRSKWSEWPRKILNRFCANGVLFCYSQSIPNSIHLECMNPSESSQTWITIFVRFRTTYCYCCCNCWLYYQIYACDS